MLVALCCKVDWLSMKLENRSFLETIWRNDEGKLN